MTFGKNRVQYNDFYWTFYQFKNYDVYFYVGGKELASYVGEQAQREMEAMEKALDYRITSRLQIIVYNKLSDLKQTNLGLVPDDPSSNIGGLTRIVGNKVLIYFDGNHIHFQQQLRAGVARVMLDQLMYGGNVRERLQAAILLNLPDWYTQGLVAHLAKGWSVEDDNKMRDLVLNKKLKKFHNLIEADEAEPRDFEVVRRTLAQLNTRKRELEPFITKRLDELAVTHLRTEPGEWGVKFLKEMMGSIGPKISSFIIVDSILTLSITVGSINNFSLSVLPPCKIFPCCR